jgi:hypothetical protein
MYILLFFMNSITEGVTRPEIPSPSFILDLTSDVRIPPSRFLCFSFDPYASLNFLGQLS